MKAWLWERYGGADALRLAEVPQPVPGLNEALIRVLGASVNAADWHSMRGKPLFSRLTLGLVRPKHQSLGVDVAGRVESVGDHVTALRPGDEVFGNLLEHGDGGFAEYVAVPIEALHLKPSSLSFSEAAAVPMAGVTALQGLNHHGPIDEGQSVLVNGGSGGVGTFAVQIAKSYRPRLTVVTSTKNVELVRLLGADDVIDYTTTDFTRTGERYDLILDTVGNRSVADFRRCLAEGGRVAIAGFTDMSHLLDASLRGGKIITQVSAHVSSEDLGRLAQLIEAGEIRSVIDRTFPFSEVPDAIAYVEAGHARGKVVVDVSHSS
jgi:NADPH:quinone reductase-like Zn-dependent oxidoreductase